MDQIAPPSMNSIGIWSNEIARCLAHSGHQVTVYARRGRSRQNEIGDGVRTRYIPSLPNRWQRALIHRLYRDRLTPEKPFFASPLYFLDYALQIALDLRLRGAKIAHLQNFSQFAPILRAFNPGMQIGLHMRCEWLTQLDERTIDRRLRAVDHIFGISEYITEKIRQRFPQHAHKCQTLYNGVDVRQFTPSEQPLNGTRRLLMMGRISPEKGVHVMLAAFPEIARRFPEVHLDLVGSQKKASKEYIVSLSDQAQVSELERFYHVGYIKALHRMIPEDLQDRVHFTGYVHYTQILDYYQQAYLLVNASLSESFGRSLIEANACGVPVVAARTGGMVEVVAPGQSGLLVPPDDPARLAEAIIQLLEDPALRQRMSASSRQYVQARYTWPRIAERLVEAYQA